MMKKILMAGMFSIPMVVLSQGIEFFEGTWNEALAEAKKQEKLIFVDAYTTWCGPCKWMAKNTFPDSAVGTYFNANFINVKLDMEKEGDGMNFASKHEVRSYPTLVFVNGDGIMAHRAVGARNPEGFLELGQDALNPEKQLGTLQKLYDTQRTDPMAAINFAIAASEAGVSNTDAINRYVSLTTTEYWEKPMHLLKILQLQVPFDGALYAFVYDKQQLAKKLAGNNVVEEFLETPIEDYVMQLGKKKELSEFESGKLLLNKHLATKQAAAACAYADAVWYGRNKPEESHGKIHFYLSSHCENPSVLNQQAWGVVERKETDAQKIKDAILWVQRSIEMDANYANLDTYAWLLHMSGDKKKAKEMANKAIAAGKKEGADVSETESLLKEIDAKVK